MRIYNLVETWRYYTFSLSHFPFNNYISSIYSGRGSSTVFQSRVINENKLILGATEIQGYNQE